VGAAARGYVQASEGKKAVAVACHAAREQVEAGTREWLASAYPEDRSFGYALGDLRGFWWAEAEKAP
jgi:hypothetical protein